MEVTTLMPRHCSSLPLIQTYLQSWRGDAIKKNGDGAIGDAIKSTSCVVMIQCHGDRMTWNVLYPLFFEGRFDEHDNDDQVVMSSSFSSQLAAYLLLHHFGGYIHRLENCKDEEDENEINLDNNNNNDNEEEKNKSSSHLWHENIHKVTQSSINQWNKIAMHSPISSFSSLHKKRRCTSHITKPKIPKRQQTQNRILLLLLPPYPLPHNLFFSPPPSSSTNTPPNTIYPERLFTSHLLQQQNLFIRLKTLNAFLATLGGGYFLCRYLSTAIALARYQRTVALLMGDVDLASKCTINEAYNFIHAGRIREALRMLRRVKREAGGRGDELTVLMCQSAILFGERVGRACMFEEDGEDGRGGRKGRQQQQGEDREVKKDNNMMERDFPSSGEGEKKKEEEAMQVYSISCDSGEHNVQPIVPKAEIRGNRKQQLVDDFQRIRMEKGYVQNK